MTSTISANQQAQGATRRQRCSIGITRPNCIIRFTGRESCVEWRHKMTLDSSWNVMAHRDGRLGKWRGNWRMEWVASTLHTTSEHGVSSITTADVHTSAASSRLNWRPLADLNGLVRFARKTKSGFCACAVTFQVSSTAQSDSTWLQFYWFRSVCYLLAQTTQDS